MEGIDWGEVIRIAVEAIVAILALIFRKKLASATRTFTDTIEAAGVVASTHRAVPKKVQAVEIDVRKAIEADMVSRLKRAVKTRTEGTAVGRLIHAHKARSEAAINPGKP